MGYYSVMEMDVTVVDVKGLKKAISSVDRESELYIYFLEDLTLHDTGVLEYPDYYAKWYNSDEFWKLIFPFIADGSDLTFTGDGGEGWGWVKKNGKSIPLRLDWVEVEE